MQDTEIFSDFQEMVMHLKAVYKLPLGNTRHQPGAQKNFSFTFFAHIMGKGVAVQWWVHFFQHYINYKITHLMIRIQSIWSDTFGKSVRLTELF